MVVASEKVTSGEEPFTESDCSAKKAFDAQTRRRAVPTEARQPWRNADELQRRRSTNL